MLPHSSSIRDFYHFDDTKDNQRFFLIARPLSGVKRCCMSPLPPSPLSSPSPFFYPLAPSHLHSSHAPLLCVLLLHLCSDYSSIDSRADIAIGRYADLAIDTHNRPCRCLWGTALASSVISLSLCLLETQKHTFVPLCWQKRHTQNVQADIVASKQICKIKVLVWFMIHFKIIYVDLMEYPARVSFLLQLYFHLALPLSVYL